ncbi:MAG: GGDEF domain-containing protein, partial [Nitrospiraceae bacterium]
LRHAITGSLGVASYSNLADTPEALIQQSDAALYTAKQRGKDQVVVFKAE